MFELMFEISHTSTKFDFMVKEPFFVRFPIFFSRLKVEKHTLLNDILYVLSR